MRRRSGFQIPAFVLGLSLCLPGDGPAGAPTAADQPVREAASVTVIEIPVNVIGKDGKPVTGLKASDFTLFDNGKKQTISDLEIVDLSKSQPPQPNAPASAAPPIEAAARRHWLIVFDLSYTSVSGLLRARDGAKDFVTRAMRQTDMASVATLSVDTGWKLLVNFTADRKQLAGAIETLGLPALVSQRAAEDPLSYAFVPPGLADQGLGGVQVGGGHAGDIEENIQDLLAIQKPSTDDLARGRVLQLVKALGMMGRTLDSVRGRKHVLFFSEGFETRLLSGNAADKPAGAPFAAQQSTTQQTGDAAAHGELWRVDSDARYGTTGTRSILDTALAQCRRSDTILHTIDITGLHSDSDATGAVKPGSGTDALFTLAADTNGEFVRNANQLGGEIEKIAERTDLVYLLVYQPKSLTMPGTYHQLKVQVASPGAKVVARDGYYEPRSYVDLSPLERVLVTGDAIMGGGQKSSFSTSVLAAPFPVSDSLSQVPVIIEIPGKPLLNDLAANKGRVQVFVYATDPSGALADYVTQQMELDLTKLRSRLEAGGMKFIGTLALSAGDYTIRTLVRNDVTGDFSNTMTSLKVSQVPGVSAVVLPPLFREPPGQWLVVKANARVDSPVRNEENPFVIEGESFLPTAVPALDPGATVDVVVAAFNFGTGKKIEPLQISGEIVGADGKAQAAELQVVRRIDHQRSEGRMLLLSFKPEGLTAGRYVLKVHVSDRPAKKESEASANFEVRAPKG